MELRRESLHHLCSGWPHGPRVSSDLRVDKPWGKVFTKDEIIEAINKHQPDTVWICYAETSTGTRQPLEGIGAACRALDKECLLLVDTVTAIGGVECKVDEWLFDACYAEDKAPRVYHHTAPISMIYALREALTLIAEEGLEKVWERHTNTAEYFWKLVEDLGLEMLVTNKNERLPSLHTIRIPPNVDGGAVIKYCREKFRIEVGSGLGELSGKVFRVGLMGYNSRPEVALQVVAALKEAMEVQGWKKLN
ncbi:alanine--glyoxylate aminotransferase-like [Condylostylus longicornis]|uniref:alanine--glyoxylate aminotransferase-like n=1 Tax=Condylostylus longicornis TaxID=2530218 RepID=UPI00244E429D|nr:alanine--glyoxylate aminotransferase-like [Condylostylus longicornis]